MCESCPNCPECGETIYQPAGLDYLAGLLLPGGLMLLALWVAHVFYGGDSAAFWALVGVVAMGETMLLTTDRHPFVLAWKPDVEAGSHA